MERVILHVDCNSFFASVETVSRPSLANVPMAVAGDADARHGIILAKNELAKRYGVVTAETVWAARKKCPSLVLVPPHYDEYVRFSQSVHRIYERYTDMIEPFGIDEAWLDVSGSRALFGDGYTIAERIRREVKEELGITVSVGVSFNKVFAKLGSDYKKPDAVTVIRKEDVPRVVYPLAVDSMLFVGKQTAKQLYDCNIRTIGELAAISPAFLRSKFGKSGDMLSRYARGEDDSPVQSADAVTDAKSVSHGMTFRHDLTRPEEIRLGIDFLSEQVAYRLRKTGMLCTTVSVTVKDYLLKSVSRQAPLPQAGSVTREIAEVATSLAMSVFKQGVPVRMLSVCAMGLLREEEAVEQMDFFDDERNEKRQRRERLESAIDGIRDRFGATALQSGGVLGNDIGIDSEPKGRGAHGKS